MTQGGASLVMSGEASVRTWVILALILANVGAVPVFLITVIGVVHDAGTYFDAEGAVPKSHKPDQPAAAPAIRLVLFPLVLYLVYFMNFGKTTKQAGIAAMSFVLIVVPCLAYFVYAVKPRLPGGYADMEMVVSALLLLYFCACLLLGTILRWRIIVGSAKRPHPRCQGCGYNLTGLTEARCPECGTPFDPRLLTRQSRASRPNGKAET